MSAYITKLRSGIPLSSVSTLILIASASASTSTSTLCPHEMTEILATTLSRVSIASPTLSLPSISHYLLHRNASLKPSRSNLSAKLFAYPSLQQQSRAFSSTTSTSLTNSNLSNTIPTNDDNMGSMTSGTENEPVEILTGSSPETDKQQMNLLVGSPPILKSPQINNNRKKTIPFAPTSVRYLHNVKQPRFEFSVAEAYCPKKRYEYDFQQPSPHDLANDHCAGNIGRAHTGEDSFFTKEWTSEGPLKGSLALAVADGVGGWATVGINPAKFSHGLCERMCNEFERREDVLKSQDPKSETYHDDRTTTASPQDLLDIAYTSLRKEGDSYAGGSTACVGVISAFTGMLSVANVGDSGYFIFRRGRVYRRSSPQTHQFNTPFQLSIVPQSIQTRRKGRQPISDEPQDADLSQHQLQHGDVILFATDGLTDNVFAQDILKMVTSTMFNTHSWFTNENDEIDTADEIIGARDIAQNLVKLGINASLDPNSESPFTLRLRQEMGFVAPGGKPDDITTVVILVQEVDRIHHEHNDIIQPKL